MHRKYKIIDIYHTGNSGKKDTRKTGEPYDHRKGKIFTIDIANYKPGQNLIFWEKDNPILWTSPYVRSYEKNKRFYIETVNSVYELEVL